MKSKVNTEGLEVNQEILNAFKNFKQGSILEKSHFRVQHAINREMETNLSKEDLNRIVKGQLIQNLSSYLFDNFGDSIIEEFPTQLGLGTIYSMDGLIMPLKDFKHAVEFTIRTMPMSAIEEIRK